MVDLPINYRIKFYLKTFLEIVRINKIAKAMVIPAMTNSIGAFLIAYNLNKSKDKKREEIEKSCLRNRLLSFL